MPTGFHSLPDEIIEKILKHNESQATLRNLAICSRALYHVFFPYLYRNIRIWDAPESKSLRILAVKLVACQGVARNVKRFTLREHFSTKQSTNDLQPAWARNLRFLKGAKSDKHHVEQRILADWGLEMGGVAAKLGKLCNPAQSSTHREGQLDVESLKKVLPNTNEGALVAFLLRVMPNLKFLDMTIPDGADFLGQEYFNYGKTSIIPGEVHKSAANNYRFLGNLTEVRLGIEKECDPNNVRGTSILLHHLKTPSVRRICVRNLPTTPPDSICYHIVDLGSSTALSNVTHLEIREFTINLDTLATFVRLCKGLKTFIFEHATMYWRPEVIGRILSTTKASLETLWLGFGCLKWATSNVRESLRSMCEYKALKRLRLPMRLVFTTSDIAQPDQCILNLIPSTLEVLHLKDCNYKIEELFEALAELIAHMDTRAPALKEITVDLPFPDIPLDGMSVLGNAAAKGVSFVLRDLSPRDEYTRKGWGWDEEGDWMDDCTTHRSYNSRRAVLPTVRRERYSSKTTDAHLISAALGLQGIIDR